jgi:rhodanese-related sulfurtransferase
MKNTMEDKMKEKTFLSFLLVFIIGGGVMLYIVFKYRESLHELPESQLVLTEQHIPAAVYRKISHEEAKQLMDSKEPYVLLDVRSDSEFMESHIYGAILLPDNEIKERAEADLPDKNALILIYCGSGLRSAKAANELVKMGYTNVFDFGGIYGWPYETVKNEI